jgi:ribonuclease III
VCYALAVTHRQKILLIYLTNLVEIAFICMVICSTIDSKNRFQELAQVNGAKAPPNYVTEKLGGADHAPEFFSRVYVDGKPCGEGKGRSKKDAEKQAAEDALAKLKKRGLL